MCDKCDKADKEALDKGEILLREITPIFKKHNASNELVFLTAGSLLISAVQGMQMPPDKFIEMMSGLYSDIMGIQIIPVGMSVVNPTSEPTKPKDGLN
jgi:hypothetical protein